MDMAELGTPDFNLQKLVSNDTERTEWKKSTPIKTYGSSKKKTLSSPETDVDRTIIPEAKSSEDGRSRYGRVHKPKLSDDYLSTDRKVSQYLKLDADSQMHYFKASPYSVQKSTPRSASTSSSPRKRGRPRKDANMSQQPTDRIQMALNEVLGKVNSQVNPKSLNAPEPTSTETVEIPEQFQIIPKEEVLSDSEEAINEGDWNAGDLAWAAIGGYPYWPCIISKDPTTSVFRRVNYLGKNRNPRESLHVTFFGDNGRRSWTAASYILPFHGLDTFQALANETLGQTVKKKDPKLHRAFTIQPSVRKNWQAAVSEAESLREATRQERIQYFVTMFPPSPPPVEVKKEPKKRGRKSKLELQQLESESPILAKKIKIEPLDDVTIKIEPEDDGYDMPGTSWQQPNHIPVKIKQEPFSPMRSTLAKQESHSPSKITRIKQEPISPTRTLPETPQQFSLSPTKIKTEPMPSTSKTSTPRASRASTSGTPTTKGSGKKLGRPPGRRKKSEDFDFTPLKRKYVKKSTSDQRLKENRNKKKSEVKKITKKDKRFRDPAYEMFYDKHFDRVAAENPTLSTQDIEKFIDKMWAEVKEQKRIEFRSRDGAEMATNSENDSDSTSRSNSPPPITIPSSKTSSKRGIFLFSGARSEKVCLVCFKGSEVSEMFKCRGPCQLPLHIECADKPRYERPILIFDEKNAEVVTTDGEAESPPVTEKRKRGRPRKLSQTPPNNSATKISNAQRTSLPTPNGLVSPDGTPVKRGRGRPRKYPPPPSEGFNIQSNRGQSDSVPKKSQVSCEKQTVRLVLDSSDDESFLGFPEPPREGYEKLLSLKRKLLHEGSYDYEKDSLLFDVNAMTNSHENSQNKTEVNEISFSNQLESAVSVTGATSSVNDNINRLSEQDSNSLDFSLVLNGSNDSVILKDPTSREEGVLPEEKTTEVINSMDVDEINSSVHNEPLQVAPDTANETAETSMEVMSIFESAEEASGKNTDLSSGTEKKLTSNDHLQLRNEFAETNQSIQDEVNRGSGESAVNHYQESCNKIHNQISPVENSDSQFNISNEKTHANNLKLLGTLRGDSFESESSNNNLIMDDSSDDRLMIEENSSENPSTVDCTETNSAVLSILTEDSQSSDKVRNFESVQTKTTDIDKPKRSLSLDMPDLDCNASEDSVTIQITQNEEKTNTVHNECLELDSSLVDATSSNNEGAEDTKLDSYGNGLPLVNETISNSCSEHQPFDTAGKASDNFQKISCNNIISENSVPFSTDYDQDEDEDKLTIDEPLSVNKNEIAHVRTYSKSPRKSIDSPKAEQINNALLKLEEINNDSISLPLKESCKSPVNVEIPGLLIKDESIDEEVEMKDKNDNLNKDKIIPVAKENGDQDKSDNLNKEEVIPVKEENSNKDKNDNLNKDKGKVLPVKQENGDLNGDKAKNKGPICGLCAAGKSGPCFVCGKEEDERNRCAYCAKEYHLSCAREWPQTNISVTAKGKLLLHCPQHACHTCISDNPSSVSARFNNDRLVRCVKCPSTYHHGNYCVPAGSEILSHSQIICPRHYVHPKKGRYVINSSWCALCSMGGALICCELCPNSFHLRCLNLVSHQGPFRCEDCETGRYPLHGEIVWVKLGIFRWWPAKIVFPQEIPDNVKNIPHLRGEFAVQFYGTHNFYWVNRGRSYLYHEGDGGITVSKSRVDLNFALALAEAKEAFSNHAKEIKSREESTRCSLKPPKYVKILSNRFIGQTAKNSDSKENITHTCDCDPKEKEPCGPDSDCINRLLSVECNPTICPAGTNCYNQNFERRNYPRLAPFKTESRGWGLKTLDPIKKGSFIIEYVGEMIDEDEYRRRLANMQKNKDENFYFLTIDKDRMLDAGPKGNVARFMNHSCSPNCETQKWTVNGDTRVGLFALEDIKPETELVFNYNLATFGDTKVECKCGAPNCAGFIGAKNNSKPSTSKQAKGQTPSGDQKKGAAKNRRRKKQQAEKHSEDICFTCGNDGTLLLCDDPSCPKGYHLSCLGLTKHPAGGWVCPWHQCSVCSATKVQRCSLCINSYCAAHAAGNISHDKTRGLVCFSHNPSDSGSDWSDDRGLSEEEEPVKAKPARRGSRAKVPNGHSR